MNYLNYINHNLENWKFSNPTFKHNYHLSHAPSTLLTGYLVHDTIISGITFRRWYPETQTTSSPLVRLARVNFLGGPEQAGLLTVTKEKVHAYWALMKDSEAQKVQQIQGVPHLNPASERLQASFGGPLFQRCS